MEILIFNFYAFHLFKKQKRSPIHQSTPQLPVIWRIFKNYEGVNDGGRMEDSIIVQHAKLLPTVTVNGPAAPLPIQLPSYGLEKQQMMSQSLGIMCPHGRPGRGSSFQIDSTLTVAAIWRVSQWMENLSLLPSLPLPPSSL